MASEITLPWELFENVISRHLSFQSCYNLGLTCHRLQIKWKSWIRDLPSFVIQQCDDTRLLLFPNLTNIDISEATKITADSLKTLTNLTSLKLGSTLHILPDRLKAFIVLTDLRNFNLNEELQQNPQFVPTKEQAIAYTFNFNLGILLGLPYESRTTENQFLAELDIITVLITLPQLTSLDLGYNKMNLNELLPKLTRLTSLNLGDNEHVSDDVLCQLTNLTSLQLGYNLKVTSKGLASLTKLKYLDLGILAKLFSQPSVDELKLRGIEVIQ